MCDPFITKQTCLASGIDIVTKANPLLLPFLSVTKSHSIASTPPRRKKFVISFLVADQAIFPTQTWTRVAFSVIHVHDKHCSTARMVPMLLRVREVFE